MERLTPNKLDAPLDPLYLGNLTEQINYITSKGAYAMVQPHNYGRFYGNIITDTAGFKTWWKNVAAVYKSNPLVVFDTNNEYHDMDQKLVFDLNQAAIDGIRAAGATTQYITPEGNSWTGAWTWVSSGNGASLVALKDPQNKLVYQMHQYLDVDGSGTHDTCVSSTIFKERLQAATEWLKTNKLKGVIGEFAAGDNDVCMDALKGGLSYLQENSDVWLGAIWWAAGPWWGDVSYLALFVLMNGYADLCLVYLQHGTDCGYTGVDEDLAGNQGVFRLMRTIRVPRKCTYAINIVIYCFPSNLIDLPNEECDSESNEHKMTCCH